MNYIDGSGKSGGAGPKFMTATDRTYGIQRILYLHEQKGYKPEALFAAANVFDKYIEAVGASNFPRK